MQPLGVEVIRARPRDRSRFEHLVGSLSVTIEPISYLYIGSAQEQHLMNEEELIKVLNKYGGLTSEAISSVKFEEKYSSFHTTNNVPTIPASSVKGNIRSRIELSFRARNGKTKSCFIRATAPTRPPVARLHGWRHYKIWGEVLMENRGWSCDSTRNQQVCLVCDLFGTNGLQGLISFSDFKGEGIRLERLDLEHEVNVLAAPPNSKFRGSVSFLNLRQEELGLLFIGMGLKVSARGRAVLLGRFKYRKQVGGYELGRIIYHLERLKLSEYSEHIKFENISINPGGSLEGEDLNTLVRTLVESAMRTYEGELDVKDEVSTIEKL
jgi:CRISPR/Cas system CSM-associated protein Csm3 (group 7 of RAMP superfamily)